MSILKTNQLMLPTEVTVYLESHTKHKTLRGKIQLVLMLQQVVHTVTIGIKC
jgi:hypothetical protein